jgi:hypothetical protein
MRVQGHEMFVNGFSHNGGKVSFIASSNFEANPAGHGGRRSLYSAADQANLTGTQESDIEIPDKSDLTLIEISY